MKKNAFFALICLLFATLGQAQNLTTITGMVTKLADGSPVANHPIFCSAGDSINPVYGDAVTNTDGTYNVSLDMPPGFTQVVVTTFTNCDPNGGFITTLVNVVNSQGSADFQVCQDSFPPFPTCFADIRIVPIDSLSFQFTGDYYSNDSIPAASYSWDFGDGNTSTAQNPTHTYAQAGFYLVTLIVTGADGCTAVLQYPLETGFNGFPECMGYILYNQTGIASFDFNAQIYDANGNLATVTTYNWDFGDGNTSTDAAPSHTYAAEGVYTVQLHAITDQGCEIHACDVVFACDCPIDTFWYGCQAMFYVGYGDSLFFPTWPPLDPYTLTFYDASLGGVLTWAWDFGDGSTSTAQNPTHTYLADSTYTVTLEITTLDGCESEVSYEICVGNNCGGIPEFDCQAMFIPLPDSLGGNGLQFVDLSFSPNPIQSWSWNFGDGFSSTEQNPYHEFAQPGIYTVSLSITADSCNSVISFEIDTQNPWLFSSGQTPAQLGVATGSVSAKEPVVFQGVKLFPNPVQTDFSLAFSSQKAAAYELRITDLNGRVLSNTLRQANVGLNAARIHVANLEPGLYLAEILSEDSFQTIKFVKQ